ncbi:MAG: tRNA guanosine(34) transglycosylase Tgt [Desulfovibrionaceae bacterium]
MTQTTPGAFTIMATDGAARCGVLHTAHGPVHTPVFMPVGTQGSVKALAPRDLEDAGAQIILGNTYHLYLRPGDELVARHGGLHGFSRWDRPILTDSGGYQVFSLSALRTISKGGVEFRSHIDGSKHFFSPEKVVDIQRNLNSDIMMVLDECVPYGANHDYTAKSLALTTAWAERSRAHYPKGAAGNLLFGIVQGGFFADLRTRSAEELCAIGMDGFALGGLSVGESKPEMLDILAHTAPLLPAHKPRYLMGVGTPLDILDGIALGVDMFDCVLPTRNARNGTLYTSQGKINIKRAEFKDDERPLDPECGCYTCRTFSRAYLRHLYVAGELLSFQLNTLHNVTFYLDMAAKARAAIEAGAFAALKARYEAMFD